MWSNVLQRFVVTSRVLAIFLLSLCRHCSTSVVSRPPPTISVLNTTTSPSILRGWLSARLLLHLCYLLISAHLGSSSTPALAYSCLTLLVPKPHFQGHTSWTCINLSYSTTVICSSELVMHSHFCLWWSYPSCSDTSLPDSHTSWTCVNLSYSTTVICSSAFVVHSHFDLHGHTPLVPTPHFQTATPSWNSVNISYSTYVICSSKLIVHSHFGLRTAAPHVPVLTNYNPYEPSVLPSLLGLPKPVTSTVLPNSSPFDFSSTPSTPTARTQVKLPKLTLKKFSGDLTQWVTFWDTFDSAVHCNPNLSSVDKFSYLHFLLDSTAAEVIAGLSLTVTNYEEAVSTLKQRFGNTQHIINEHMNSLLHLTAVSSHHDIKGLRHLYDSIESNIWEAFMPLECQQTHMDPFSPISWWTNCLLESAL